MPPKTDAPMQGADHRAGIAAQRLQLLLELKQRGSGKADDLPATIQQMDLLQPQRADDDNLAVVLVAIRRRSAGKTGVGRLHDHDLSGRGTELQHAPLLEERARPHHGERRAVPKAKSFAESVTTCWRTTAPAAAPA